MKIRVREELKKIVAAVVRTLKIYPVEIALAFYTFVIGILLVEDVQFNNEENMLLVPLFLSFSYLLNNIFPRRLCRKNEKRRQTERNERKSALAKIYEEKLQDQKAAAEAAKPESSAIIVKRGNERLFYYLSWLPVIPLWWVDVSSWIESWGYWVALAIAFLAFFVARRSRDNRQFAAEGFKYIINLFVTVVFVSVAYGLMLGIYFSIIYIFGIDVNSIRFVAYGALFCYALAAPIMFFTFVQDNISKPLSRSTFIDTLLNYIVTPALLIYSLVMFVYFIKILITWSLPAGGIAYMVFAFTMISMLVKAAQPLLERRFYDWYFDRFSLIAIPPVIMFWIGVVYRINEYGLTQWRVYLLLCGVIMTLTLVMFWKRNKGNYLIVTAIAILLLAVFTYIPPISAESIAQYSQKERVINRATLLGMLDEQGHFKREDLVVIESSDENYQLVSEIESSLRSLDLKRLEKLGLTSAGEFTAMYPYLDNFPALFSGATNSIYLYYEHTAMLDISGYSELYQPASYKDANNKYYYNTLDQTLRLYKRIDDGQFADSRLLDIGENEFDSDDALDSETLEVELGKDVQALEVDLYEDIRYELIFERSFDDIFTAQLAKMGTSADSPTAVDIIRKRQAGFLTYEADNMKFVFSQAYVLSTDGKIELTSLSINYLLTR